MTAAATAMHRLRLARARSAYEDRVALGVEEAALAEFSNLAFIDRRVGKDELVDILENRELRARDAITDRARLPVGALGADEAGDERVKLVAPGKALAGDLVEAGAHAVELEFAHGLQDIVTFHQAIFLNLS
jgi:hypothetical protein